MERLLDKKKFFLISILSMILVTATVTAGGVYDFGVKEGSIEVDGESYEIKTNLGTVEELLEEKDIELAKEDYISLKENTELKDKFEIKIKRAIPIILTLDGVQTEIMTSENNVKELLKSKSIYYDQKDIITPESNVELTPYMEVSLIRVTELFRTDEEEISYKSESRENPDLEKGKTNVIQYGANGLKSKEIKETHKNKELVSEEVVGETILKEAVNEIVEHGTKETAIMMRATAYDDSNESNGGYGGLTALGTRLRPGVIAVDPKIIPLGSKVYIEHADGTPHGYGIAEDVGGAIKGNRIDIFMDASQVRNFGVKSMKVYIVE